jgi:hypothetical protein
MLMKFYIKVTPQKTFLGNDTKNTCQNEEKIKQPEQ